MHFDEIKQQQADHEAEAEDAPLANDKDNGNGHSEKAASLLSLSHMSITGNLCPQCGCNTMVYEEGCKKCYNCGHSEC
jgi:ribonucleoside-diphosphate reductase alpha chain